MQFDVNLQLHYFIRNSQIRQYLFNLIDIINKELQSSATRNRLKSKISASPLDERRDQDIIQWNLETYETTTIPFTRDLKGYSLCEYFSESQLLCLTESESEYRTDKYEIKQMKVKFYQFPLQQTNSFLPKHMISLLPQKYLIQDVSIVKLNNRSLVWCYDKSILKHQNFRTSLLLFDPLQKWAVFTLHLEIEGFLLSIDWDLCSIKIVDLYEVKPEFLYMRVGVEPDTQKLNNRLLDEQEILYEYEREYDYIWDLKVNKIQIIDFGTRKCHFIQFMGNFRQINTSIQIKKYIKTARNKRMSLMRSKDRHDIKFCMEDNKFYQWEGSQVKEREFPIIYVDPNSMQILAKQTHKFHIASYYGRDPSWVKIQPCQHRGTMLVEFWEEKKKNKAFMRVKKVRELPFSSVEIAVNMICEYVQEPDDDLVWFVANILSNKEEQWQWGEQKQEQLKQSSAHKENPQIKENIQQQQGLELDEMNEI